MRPTTDPRLLALLTRAGFTPKGDNPRHLHHQGSGWHVLLSTERPQGLTLWHPQQALSESADAWTPGALRQALERLQLLTPTT